jgi:dihydroorotate dehydrogenase electron transfer subunit
VRSFLGDVAELRPAGDALLVRVRAPPIARRSHAGQFVLDRAASPGRWDPLLRRPRWIARADGEDVWLWYQNGRPGNQVDLLGPLGHGFTIAPASRSVLLVGEGAGLAPLLSLADDASAHDLSVTLLAGFSSADCALAAEWVAPQVEYVTATLDGSIGHRGHAADLIPRYLDWADELFVAIPGGLRETVAPTIAGTSKPVQVALDGWQGCGTGLCGACLVRTTRGAMRIYRDGPIFPFTALR